MRKRVGILVFDEVEVLDFAGPFEVFSVASQLHNQALFDVKLIARTKQSIFAVNGLSVNPHYSFEDCPAPEIFIIAGGSGTRPLLKNVEYLHWVDRTIKQAKLTLSICSGARLLAKLGHLNNRPYCTHKGVYQHLSELVLSGKPQYEKRFVQSGPKLYTSGGISAGIDLSFHIIAKLLGEGVAESTASYLEYDIYKY